MSQRDPGQFQGDKGRPRHCKTQHEVLCRYVHEYPAPGGRVRPNLLCEYVLVCDCSGNGIITSFLILDFEGLTTFGVLNLTVTSLSSLSATYELSLNCSEDIKPVSSKTVSIPGKTSLNVSFNIYTDTSLRSNHSCLAHLLSATGKELHRQEIRFTSESTSFEGRLA